MKAAFVHSHKFLKNDDKYYSDGKLTYEMWYQRYLKYFESLTILANVKDDKITQSFNLSSGENVYFIENHKSKFKLFRFFKSVFKENNFDVVIIRLPSFEGLIALKVAKLLKINTVIELVGDPFEAYWNYGNKKGKIMAIIMYFYYRLVLAKEKYFICVTKEALQKKYLPIHKDILVSSISNVNIITPKENTNLKNFVPLKQKKNINIGLIGSYFNENKGISTAIKAIKVVQNKNLDKNIYLNILGNGKRENYIELINEQKLNKNIIFYNSIKGGEEVLNWLDKQDIYIQPSLTEGLPRALIEAMSRGKPSIATNVGGIPELLQPSMLINKKDYSGLADKINLLILDKNLYESTSELNYNIAKNYDVLVLNESRDVFWNKIKGDLK